MELDHHCVFFDACIGKSNMNLFICTICMFFVILLLTVIMAAVSDHGGYSKFDHTLEDSTNAS